MENIATTIHTTRYTLIEHTTLPIGKASFGNCYIRLYTCLDNDATVNFLIQAITKGLTFFNPPSLPGALYNGHLECRLLLCPHQAVLKEFCKPDAKLRVLVATTAFGMGIDCPDIDIIINWRCPNTLEELVEETGVKEMDVL